MRRTERERQDQKNAAWRTWYEKNKSQYNKESVIRLARRRVSKRIWLRELKSEMKCARCGFNHPAALDFHHKDKESKVLAIANALRDGWTRERILEEIGKCEILCANCHRIEHDLF